MHSNAILPSTRACARPWNRVADARVRRNICRTPAASLASGTSSEPISDKLRRTIKLFYEEVFNNGTPELIPSLCSRSVTFSDARGHCDFLGAAGVAAMVEGMTSSHPLLRVELDDVAVDPSGARAVAEWHATAAHLLPGRAGGAPTGLVSEICGLDEISFAPDGRISSIVSFRERFSEEEEGEGEGAAADAGAGYYYEADAEDGL